MDVVEAGRERGPFPRGVLFAGAVALAVLAVNATARYADSPGRRAAARRTPPATVPAAATAAAPPLGNLVASRGALTAPPLAPADALTLLLSGQTVVTEVTTANDAERTVLETGAERIQAVVPLREGFALLARDDFAEGPGTLVVSHRGRITRQPLDSFTLMPGATDTEFWSDAGALAQRWDARGRRLGRPIRLAYGGLVRGLSGDRLLLMEGEHTTSLVVWNARTRRVERALGDSLTTWSTTPGHALTGGGCATGACPFVVTDLTTGRARRVALPSAPGDVHSAALSPDGKTFAVVWSSPHGVSNDLYVALPGDVQPRLVARGLPSTVRLHWAAPGRLAILQVVDAQLVVVVWDAATRRLGQAGVYEARELSGFVARTAVGTAR